MKQKKNLWGPRRNSPGTLARWPVSVRLSTVLTLVSIVITALCLPGCATTRKTQTEQAQSRQTVTVHDTVQTFTRMIQTEPVPESRVEMTITVDSLLKLPQGATYHRKSGQAHAEVSIRGDTIYVTGTCDSLARQVEYYENLYHTARDALENQSRESANAESKGRPYPAWLLILTFCVGLALGATTTIFITAKFRKNE